MAPLTKADVESYLEKHAINQNIQNAINAAVKAQTPEPNVHIGASLLAASGVLVPGLAAALKQLSTAPQTGPDALKFLLAELAKPQLQSAFVFTKPHANTAEVRELISTKFKEMGIEVLTEGDMDGPTIDAKKHIDQHYYAIASKATLLKPAELNVPKEKFSAHFNEEWDAVVAAGRVFNAMDTCANLGVDVPALNAAWGAAQEAKKCVKLGGGFYCALVEVEGKEPVYTLNAFFMSMRSKFTSESASIHYYVVEWDANQLSWADFRGSVLGPTDPAKAPATSLRGTLHSSWESLGLAAAPNTTDNGVHASASPFEGLAERMNWLSKGVAEDGFGAKLLAEGVSEELIKAWSVDPQVNKPGGEKGSLFDALEDLNLEECLAKAAQLARLQ